MGMIWRMLKWGTVAVGAYYVWQNFVRPEMERARPASETDLAPAIP